MRKYFATMFSVALSLVVLLSGCKSSGDKASSDVLTIAADANANNEALFLGFPTQDPWISNNLWPVKRALEDKDVDQGFNIAAHDNVGKAAALQKIKDAAGKVTQAAVDVKHGAFITDVINFLVVAGVVFRLRNRCTRRREGGHTDEEVLRET